MADLVHEARNEFWRPPTHYPDAVAVLADACSRCCTEFMVGAAFCHICGAGRHRTGAALTGSWMKYFQVTRILNLSRVKEALGLPVPALFAFLAGVAFLVIALTLGLMSTRDLSDFQALQLWRIQWLMAACAAFLAGILLKSPRSEN